MRIGVIDIGSDSIKMIIANTDSGLTIEKELKKYLILSEASNNILTRNSMNEAISTLTEFAKACSGTDKIIVVATEAVRNAENQQEFIKKVKQVVGLDIRVLTGEEEAYYDYFAIVNSLQVEDHDLLMDLGGKSTELVLIKAGKIEHFVSLQFGVVTLTDKFKLHDKQTSAQEDELKDYINIYFDKLDWIKKAKGHNLIGLGGSITNIGSIYLKENNKSLGLLNKHLVPAEEIKQIYYKIKNESDAKRLHEKGLEKEEVDFVVVAAEVVDILIDRLEIKNVIFSNNGIREGLIYKEIEGSCNN